MGIPAGRNGRRAARLARAAAEPNLPESARWTAVDGLRIRYAEVGRRSGPDTLLLLSSPGDLDAFAPLWAAAAGAGRIVAVDLPGLGVSEGRPILLSPLAMAAFVVKAIDAFRLRHPHLGAPCELLATALFACLLHPGALESLVLFEKPTTGGSPPGGDEELAFGRADAEAWSGFGAQLSLIATPILVVTAKRPESLAQLELLRAGLPRCSLEIVGGGASAPDDRNATGPAAIAAWIGGRYRTVPLRQTEDFRPPPADPSNGRPP